eukprot:SAG11_NODE_2153_length_3740_cov_13.654765_3_plen_120_part_00
MVHDANDKTRPVREKWTLSQPSAMELVGRRTWAELDGREVAGQAKLRGTVVGARLRSFQQTVVQQDGLVVKVWEVEECTLTAKSLEGLWSFHGYDGAHREVWDGHFAAVQVADVQPKER